MARTLSAVYADRPTAQSVVQRLVDERTPRHHIRFDQLDNGRVQVTAWVMTTFLKQARSIMQEEFDGSDFEETRTTLAEAVNPA
jgi:hypothetical protein